MAVRPASDAAPVTTLATTSGPRSWAPPAVTEWTPPSWEQIVRDHSARVYRLAYRLTGNSHDAEDLTQDVFVRVFRSLHTFQPGTFEGWLHRITTNLFLDSARRKQKIRFDGLVDGSEERLPSNWPTPSEALADAGLDHDVAAALAALAWHRRLLPVFTGVFATQGCILVKDGLRQLGRGNGRLRSPMPAATQAESAALAACLRSAGLLPPEGTESGPAKESGNPTSD